MANVAIKLQGQMPPNFFCFISRVYDPDTRKIVQKKNLNDIFIHFIVKFI